MSFGKGLKIYFQVKVTETKAAKFEDIAIKENIALSRIIEKLIDDWMSVEHFPGEEAMETVILTPGQFKKEVVSPRRDRRDPGDGDYSSKGGRTEQAAEDARTGRRGYPNRDPSARF